MAEFGGMQGRGLGFAVVAVDGCDRVYKEKDTRRNEISGSSTVRGDYRVESLKGIYITGGIQNRCK